MRKSSRRKEFSGKSRAQVAKQPIFAKVISILLTIGAITAAAFFLFHGKPTGAQSPAPPVSKESSATLETKAGYDRLQGRWRRPDGGYVIDISEIDARGKMVARYYNPRPINVSRAEASQEGTTTKVFIELRDTNYPGATYNLTYDPGSDQLRGIYFQPALNQSFDVVFVRLK